MAQDSTTTKKAGVALIEAVNPLTWKSWRDSEGIVFNGIKIAALYFLYRMARGK